MLTGGFVGTTKVLAVVALSLSLLPLAHSQTNLVLMTDEYAPRHFNKEHGLPDNQAQAILQTRDGYLWIATRAGLARFDGLKFTVFDHLTTPAMRYDDCRSLAEGSDGSLWIAAKDGLLQKAGNAFFLRVEEDFIPFGMCTSQYGGVWLGCDQMSLARFCWPDFKEYRPDIVELGMGAGPVFAVEEDEMGVFWAGALTGLLRRDPSVGRFEQVTPDEDFARQPVVALRRGSNGELWVLFANRLPGKWFSNKAWLACLKYGRWLRSSQLDKPDFTFDPRSTFLALDRSGNLWLPSAGGGLNRFRDGKFTFHAFGSTVQNDFALCVQEDREGNLWIGTESNGLLRWTPRKISSYSTSDGLPHDNIWTICEAGDGSVWIGTDGGVSQFKEGHFVSFTQDDGLSRNEVRSVVETSDGTIWAGTLNGLDSIRNGQISHVRFPGEWFETKIRALLAARDGALWVGTVRGLTRLHDGEQIKYGVTNGFGALEVRALLEDRRGNLWIGTLGGGLSRFHEGKFNTFTTTNGLSNNNVWALHEDSAGDLWIGTERGLNRLKNGQFTVYTTGEGLPADVVNAILEDDLGRLWVTHDRGIFSVPRAELNALADGKIKTLRCVTYDETDGLPSLETNGQKSYPAACKTRDGRLWFPTTKGVAIIDPSTVALDDVPPLAAIERVRANGSVLYHSGPRANDQSSGLPKAYGSDGRGGTNSQPSTLIHQLAPGSARVLEFHYTANAFVAPENARFKYRMVGLNEKWIEAGTRREAYFTDLRPGDYEFEVIAANHRGVWQERGATFAFHLSPFIYQTWWFYLLCGGGVAGMVTVIVAWRMRELRRIHRLEQQAAIVEERSRLAKDLHDGLGADLTRLTMLADLAGGDTVEAGAEHLKKLSKSSREAARELKELIWIADPGNDSVDGLISRICQNAEDFLRDARIKCRLDIAPRLPEKALSTEQRRNLLLVTREALNNVVKHAGATEVCISANGSENGLQLTIEDNGRGFDPATARSDGLGLNSMRRRLESMGGSFELKSGPGVGTKISITMKLSNS